MSRTIDFVMSTLSSAVGMGNLWRFPYLCYRNGGGAFLIAYLLIVVLAGFPLMLMEMLFGQFGLQGVVSIWKASPLFRGIGWTMFSVTFMITMYYNMLVAYSFYYIFASFTKDVPWRSCDNPWNTPGCGGISQNVTQELLQQQSDSETEQVIRVRSAADEYFNLKMLDISSGITSLGAVRWQLALCLLLSWVLVFVVVFLRFRFLRRVTYVIALFPFVMLLCLFVRGVMLEGSSEGILYYITPQLSDLGSPKVWGEAAVQVFYSMSICFGSIIATASYNIFSNNCFRDSVVMTIADTLTSVFTGFVVFAFIGHIAKDIGVSVEEAVTQGAGVPFIAYTSAFTTLPSASAWTSFYMFMLVIVGINSQVTLLTTIETTLVEVFPKLRRSRIFPLLLRSGICLLGYGVGLILCSQGGMYVLQIMDTYAPYALLAAGLAEIIVISYVYGLDQFFEDIENMIGSKPSVVWKIFWKGITPAIIAFMLALRLVGSAHSTYGDYRYPLYADALGWLIAVAEILCIPVVGILILITTNTDMPLLERVRHLCRPSEDWGPEQFRRGKDKESENSDPLTDTEGKEEKSKDELERGRLTFL